MYTTQHNLQYSEHTHDEFEPHFEARIEHFGSKRRTERCFEANSCFERASSRICVGSKRVSRLFRGCFEAISWPEPQIEP